VNYGRLYRDRDILRGNEVSHDMLEVGRRLEGQRILSW